MRWLNWIKQRIDRSMLSAPKRWQRPFVALRIEMLEPRVTPTGNLAITSASVVDGNDQPLSAVNIGETVYIQANFTTQDLPSNASYRVGYTVNGLTLDTGDLTWGAGTSGTSSWFAYWGSFIATPGTNQVTVTVDPDQSVAETTYADNTFSFTFTAVSPQVSGSLLSYTPAQVRAAYGINSIANFGSAPADGTGQTIALVEIGNDPTVITDLDGFDQGMSLTSQSSQTLYQQYGPASSILTVYNQNGVSITANVADSGSDGVPAEGPNPGEENMDVEWAHALAPGAKIDVIEITDDANWTTNLLMGDGLAATLPDVSAVSNSWGLTEWSGETAYDSSTFVTPSGHTGVTFLTASNDNGANVYGAFGPSVGGDGYYPATSPNVVSVGGTQLTLDNDAYGSETGWSYPTPTSTVDNGSPSYTQTGSWTSQAGGFGGSYSTAPGGGSSSAVWTIPVTPANTGWGTELSATWTASPTNATNATYTIYDGTQASGTVLATVVVNQTEAPDGTADGASQFQELGVFFPTLTASGTGTLTVVLNANSANGTVVADAIGSAPAWASTGGPSRFEAEPSYQSSFQSTGYRTTPDVSFDASFDSGVTCYFNGQWTYSNGGTSLGSPCWAALIAIVNQGRVAAGGSPLNSPTNPIQTLQALYSLPASDFHDITTGYNGFNAGPGYDLVTGRGTPIANTLVPDLVRYELSSSDIVINPIPPQTVATDGSGTLSFVITAQSKNGSAITFSPGSGTPAGASINAQTGLFSWAPSEWNGNAPGVYNVSVVVAETNDPLVSNTVTFTVTVGPSSTDQGAGLASRTAVAAGVDNSQEYYTDLLDADYLNYVNRLPTQAELTSFWYPNLPIPAQASAGADFTDQEIEAYFIGSPEYIQDNGGTDQGWIAGMYMSILGRPAQQSEINYWLNQKQADLNSGMSVGDADIAVAQGIVASNASESILVGADYKKYLGRSGSASEIAYWVNLFLTGYTNEQVIAGFVGSQEFFQDHGSDIVDWLFADYQATLNRLPDVNGFQYWENQLQ